MIIHDCIQGTPEWKNLRHSKPTSSMFGSIISSTMKPSDSMKDYAHLLATEKRMKGPSQDRFKGNFYTERGKELESVSRADYEMTNQVEVQEVGFITDDLMRWGASTDGLVGDDGVVEFKNLIDTEFTKLIIYTRQHDKTPPQHIPQVQGELFVTERKWCDIVFYHPDPEFEPIVFRHYPDPVFHKALEVQLKLCIAERNRIFKLIK